MTISGATASNNANRKTSETISTMLKDTQMKKQGHKLCFANATSMNLNGPLDPTPIRLILGSPSLNFVALPATFAITQRLQTPVAISNVCINRCKEWVKEVQDLVPSFKLHTIDKDAAQEILHDLTKFPKNLGELKLFFKNLRPSR